jgi:hypothetical protein
MKKIQPENIQYWLTRGYSEIDAEYEVTRRKGSRCKWHRNYYIFRGYSESEADEMVRVAKQTAPANKAARLDRFNGDVAAYRKWVDENCGLSKQNMLKRMTLDQYNSIKKADGDKLINAGPMWEKYWIDKGFTAEVATKKVSETAKRGSRRCVDFWVARGYDIEDAVVQVKIFQTKSSIDAMIKKYGTEEGTSRYNKFIEKTRANSKRCTEYWALQGYTDKDAIELVHKHQSEISVQGPHRIDYWLKLGYELAAAEKMRYNHVAKKFASTLVYWINRGFSMSDADKLRKAFQSKSGKLGALAQRYEHISSLEIKFDKATSGVDKIWTSYVKNPTSGKFYFPDFEFTGCFVEIYGDYWHANPNLYGPNHLMAYDERAEEVWVRDAERVNDIQAVTGKQVFIIWESEIKNETLLQEKLNEISKYY